MNLTDRDYACLYKALADETRIGIVRLLADGERSVGEIVRHFGGEASYARISHHLAILKGERLVSDRRQGKQILYSLSGVVELLASNRSFCWMKGASEVATVLHRFIEEPEEATAMTVFAASSLSHALREIGPAFRKDEGKAIRFRFGSSWALARALEAGERAELFASASAEEIQCLQAGRLIDDSSVFARGRLTIWRRAEHPATINDLRDLLQPEVRWVVIPNPASAPSGERAYEALDSCGIWEALQPKVILANDAAQAREFADTANDGVAITSLAVAAHDGQNTLIPEGMHRPLEHSIALTRHASPEAGAFARYLSGRKSRSILKQYGFLVS